MVRRERGFTLIEILVVITIIATLAGLVAALAPKMIREGKKTTCMNNLKQLGGLLLTADTANTIKPYKGAAFLLQVKDELSNDQLKAFICPGEEYAGDDPRPELGSDEFAAMYRDVQLPDGVEPRLTSYAGPEKFKKPPAGPLKFETWLWGCDRCDGAMYHDGIVVLTSSGSVEFWKPDKITGWDDNVGVIEIGANSPDARLARMRFYPDR